MKPKILFILFLLLASCTKQVAQTPIETEIVTTKVLSTPTSPTVEIFPTASPETPAVEVAKAYPPVSSTQNLSDEAYPVPAIGPTPIPRPSPTPTATPAPEQRLNAAKNSWESCRGKWSGRELDIPENKDLAGLVFYYGRTQQGTSGERWESIWKLDEQGKPIFIACPVVRGFEAKNNRMLFQHDNDFWLANLQNGTVEQVSDSPDLMPYFAAWSSDGRYVYYDKYDTSTMRAADIWVYDSQKKENHQVTFSPNTGKVRIAAWPGHPDWIFYEALPNEPGPWTGDSFLINIAGSADAYIGNQPLPGLPSFSPDGQTAAFAGEDKLWLVQLYQAPKVITLGQYRAGKWTLRGGSNPDWSPDGNWIVLEGTAWNETGDFTGLIVLDPVTKNASFLHPFTPIAREGSVLAYQWSSDNRWLSLITSDENPAKAGLWILRADGSYEQYIGSASSSYWSQQADRLLYYGGPANPGHWLLNIKTMKSIPLNLPDQMAIIRWGRP